MEFDARSLVFIPADAERLIAKGAAWRRRDHPGPGRRRRACLRAQASAALPSAVKQLHAGVATVFVRASNEPELLANGADGIACRKWKRRGRASARWWKPSGVSP